MSKFQNLYNSINNEDQVIPFIFDPETICSDILFLREEYINKGDEDDQYYEEECMTYQSLGGNKYYVFLRTPEDSYIGKHTIFAQVQIALDDDEEITISSITNLLVDGKSVDNEETESEAFKSFLYYCISDGWSDFEYVDYSDIIVLNKNVKLKNGGRKAPKMSVEDFTNLIYEKVLVDEDDDTDFHPACIYNALMYQPKGKKMEKDFEKFEVGDEDICTLKDIDESRPNINFLDENGSILMTSSGVPYIFGLRGGDGEVLVAFMIYWDGKNFRGYYPTKGNTINTKTKSGISDTAEDFDVEFIKKDTGVEVDEDYLTTKLLPAFDLCIEDFEARIEAI